MVKQRIYLIELIDGHEASLPDRQARRQRSLYEGTPTAEEYKGKTAVPPIAYFCY